MPFKLLNPCSGATDSLIVCCRSVLILGLCLVASGNTILAQNDTNGKRLTIVNKEVWQDDNWVKEFQAQFHYDDEGRQTVIQYATWESDHWENVAVINNSYNSAGLLEEREERRIKPSTLISRELYEYDAQENLRSIATPDSTWFRVRRVSGVTLMSHNLQMEYDYTTTGLFYGARFSAYSDVIPDCLSVGATIETDMVNRYHRISYNSNGNQLAAVYRQDPRFPGFLNDKLWDFYDIWHPCEVRVVWLYSDKRASVLPYHFALAHIPPENRHIIFKNQLTFWLSKSEFSDSPSYGLPLYGIKTRSPVNTEYLTSKLNKPRSFIESGIPGNYYQYFYEPRFLISNPLREQQLIEVMEQYSLSIFKYNSPLYYKFNWDYNNTWITSIKRTFEYDDNGRLTAGTIKLWKWDFESFHPDEGWWVNDSRYEFTYDASGNGSIIHRYIWDDESETWQNAARMTYTYEDIPAGKVQNTNQIEMQLTNHPNPFSGSTVISFRTENPSTASLKIYDLSGQLIRTLFESEPLPPAEHSYRWDGTDQFGRPVSSGVYLYRLNIGDQHITGRCLVVK